MTVFEQFYPDVDFTNHEETLVMCPFHLDTTASMAVNVEKKVYYCHTCGAKGNDVTFARKIFGASAISELEKLKSGVNQHIEENDTQDYERLNVEFQFDSKILRDLKVTTNPTLSQINFKLPIYSYSGKLIDYRTYRKDGTPKCTSSKGGTTGMVVPIEIAKRDKKPMILVAGEKDMLIARSKGFNAYCITGGESRLPILFGDIFENRIVFVCYDNDSAGQTGATKLQDFLMKQKATAIILDISSVCIENKEDVFDYFVKYNKTKEDFLGLISDTYNKFKTSLASQHTIHIEACTNPKYYGKTLKSRIYTIANIQKQYGVNLHFEVVYLVSTRDGKGYKYDKFKFKHKFKKDKEILWMYNTKNDAKYREIFKEAASINFFKNNPGSKPNKIEVLSYEPIVETPDDVTPVHEYLIGRSTSKLGDEESYLDNYGRNKDAPIKLITTKPIQIANTYDIIYEVVYNTEKGNDINLFAHNTLSCSQIDSFTIDDSVKDSLNAVRSMVKYMDGFCNLEQLTEDAKSFVGTGFDKLMYTMMMLVFHSQLEIKVGDHVESGVLDGLFVSNTSVGKSGNAEAIKKRLEFGTTINLANTSIAGLIGGCITMSGVDVIKIGEFTRQHKKLCVMEELSKADENLIDQLTQTRTSKKAVINKIVHGEFDANVRCITLANPKVRSAGRAKTVDSYSNGIQMIYDLIKAPEDISRYDFIMIPESVNNWKPIYAQEVLSKKVYMDRHNWAITRKINDIEYEPGFYEHLTKISKALNDLYEAHDIKLFCVKTMSRLTKMSVALAGYTASVGSDYSKLLVKREHVNTVAKLLQAIYNSENFNLQEYVKTNKGANEFTSSDLELIKSWKEFNNEYWKLACLLKDQTDLQTASFAKMLGTSDLAANVVIGEFNKHSFIKSNKGTFNATPKFHKCMRALNKEDKVSEVDGLI